MRILFADDDPNFQRMVELYLRDTEVEIDFARDGRQALMELQNNEYDILFTDLQMPQMSGLELIKALEERTMPVIVISAFGQENQARKAIDNGADDVLSKPFTSAQLKEMIKKHGNPRQS